MAELYLIGINRIFYKAEKFGIGKTVTAYFWNPILVKSSIQTLTELESGLYYIDYNFSIEGNYVGLFYENLIPTTFYSLKVMSGFGSSEVIFPPTQVSVFSNIVYENVEKEISRGDTPTFTFDLNKDYNHWDAYFAIKKNPEDTDYSMEPTICIWVGGNGSSGQGSITLTTDNTNLIGNYIGEVELRNGNSRLTVIKFYLTFTQDIIV